MLRLSIVVAAALAAAGCAGPPPPSTTPDLEPGVFTLGYAVDSTLDRTLVRAAELAIDEINGEGGVGGAIRLELVVDEEGGDPSEAARRLVFRGVQALVLACDAEIARAQADVADRTQILAFAPCNDDPTIAERYPVVWPVSLGANAEAAALADHALARRYDSIAPRHTWPEFLRYLMQAAAARGIRVDDAGAPVGTHLSEVYGAEAGVAYTTFGFPSPRSAAADFYSRFARKYGTAPPGSFAALGYDVIRVAAAAIAGAGSADSAAIAERLASGLTVEGALGEIVYPGAGERQPEVAASVVELVDGKLVLVEKSLPENIPPP